MDGQVLILGAVLVAGVLGAGLILVLGYTWGKFAALKALAESSPKWKAYLVALLPPAAFAATLLLDGTLGPFAYQMFFALATPAAFGTCVRINHGSYSAF
jgi:hypothetical protein